MADILWKADEFEYRPKDVGWYWISIIIAVALIAVAVWQKNFLFGFFVVVAEVLILVWGSRIPEELEFSLGSEKLRIKDRREYSLRDIAEYSILDVEGEHAHFILVFRQSLRPSMKIPVPQHIREDVRERFGKAEIKEVEHEHNLIDTLEHFIGF